MARPLKKGLEYFPLDVRIFNDEKIRVLRYKVGPNGIMVYLKILTMIYENGYYLEMKVDDLAKVIHQDFGPEWFKLERISVFIHACLESGLFDEELSGQGVITSVAVQKQYLLSTARRKDINIDKYWLLEPSESVRPADASLSIPKERVNVNNNRVNVDNNSVNVDISTQSKSKRKIDKKINIDKRAFGQPKLHFITNALIKNKYIEADDLSIGNFNMLAQDLVDAYGFDMVLSVTDYIIKVSKREHIEIENKFKYFKTSAEHNLRVLEKRNNGGYFDIEAELKKLTQAMGKSNKKVWSTITFVIWEVRIFRS